MLILNSVSVSDVWRTGRSEALLEAPRKDVMVQAASGGAHTRLPWCSPVVRRDGGHSECVGCKWLWGLRPNMSVVEQALFRGLGSYWLKS